MAFSTILFALTLMIGGGSDLNGGSPPAPEQVSVDEGSDALFVEYLLVALEAGNKAGRLSYNGKECDERGGYPSPAIQLSIQSPSKTTVALTAVRGIFRDQFVTVAEQPGGIIRTRVGEVPDAILRTRIRKLDLTLQARYYPRTAINEIENSPEMLEAMRKLGMRESQLVSSVLVAWPPEGEPRLPATLTDITVEQALDMVASRFHVLVLYAKCDRPNLFHIDYAVIDDAARLIEIDREFRRRGPGARVIPSPPNVNAPSAPLQQ